MLGVVRHTAYFVGAVASLVACVQRVEIGELLAIQNDGGSAGASSIEIEVERFATPIAASWATTCALTSSGGVACWGSNGSGELGVGDETLSSSDTPLTPNGLASGAQAVFGGGSGFCAMRDTGRFECWGFVIYGEFNGEPVYAATLEPWEMPFIGDDTVQVVVGNEWLCLLTRAGQAKCWGIGSSGQLGNGSTDDAYQPHDVADIAGERYVELAASGFHTCGVTSEAGVMCWGHNGAGELGAPGPNQLLPTAVAIADVRNIAAGGYHTCARKEDGSVWCWGDNTWGQLGGAAPGGAVPNLPAATALAAGGDQTCVITNDGAVWCWGVVTSDAFTPPIQVVEASFGATAIACGGVHACAINAAHRVRCWGANFGQSDLQL